MDMGVRELDLNALEHILFQPLHCAERENDT